MASSPIRAVSRAIDLLQALNRQPVSSIDDLHGQTGIPKPTIVRLLRTFVAKGLACHAPKHGAYYLTSQVQSLSVGYHSVPKIVEAAAPLLDAMTSRVKWPTAVAVPDGNAVIIRYSTVPHSPLALLHSSINMRLSLVTRALGRAFLAFCDNDERDFILKALSESSEPEDALARNLPAGLIEARYRRMCRRHARHVRQHQADHFIGGADRFLQRDQVPLLLGNAEPDQFGLRPLKISVGLSAR